MPLILLLHDSHLVFLFLFLWFSSVFCQNQKIYFHDVLNISRIANDFFLCRGGDRWWLFRMFLFRPARLSAGIHTASPSLIQTIFGNLLSQEFARGIRRQLEQFIYPEKRTYNKWTNETISERWHLCVLSQCAMACRLHFAAFPQISKWKNYCKDLRPRIEWGTRMKVSKTVSWLPIQNAEEMANVVRLFRVRISAAWTWPLHSSESGRNERKMK